jgi:hypothetical protein
MSASTQTERLEKILREMLQVKPEEREKLLRIVREHKPQKIMKALRAVIVVDRHGRRKATVTLDEFEQILKKTRF